MDNCDWCNLSEEDKVKEKLRGVTRQNRPILRKQGQAFTRPRLFQLRQSLAGEADTRPLPR